MTDSRFACPCCGYKTLREDAYRSHGICQVCFWEDDPTQFDDPDCEGGANSVSLRQGQRNFINFGACERDMICYVRKAWKGEERDEDWKPLDHIKH